MEERASRQVQMWRSAAPGTRRGWAGPKRARLALAAGLLVSLAACEDDRAGRELEDAGSGATVSETSYRQARQLLERAMAAMGDLQALTTAGPLYFHAEGTLDKDAERQGRAPGVPSPGSFRETLVVDPASERAAWEYREDRFDGTYEWLREAYTGDEHLIVVLQSGFAVTVVTPRNAEARRKLYRRVPQLLVAEALEQPTALRYLGRREAGDAIATRLSTGETLTLFFAPEDGVLARVEYLADLEAYGDATVAWEFDDYAPLAGVGRFPGRYRSFVAGQPYTDMQVAEVALGSTRAMFEVPGGVREFPPDTALDAEDDASSGARVDSLGPGLFRITDLRGGFHPIFIEFDDFVVAVDAPAGFPLLNELPAGDVAPGPSSAWLSERYLGLIRATLPDKPVRYVIITHFHSDHVGGVRAFVAEGATVLAPSSAAAAIGELVEAPHTIAPDRLSRSPRPLRLEVVEGSRVITDGRRSLEVLDVGDNPHGAHMLVVRLPGEGVMFVSDLLDPTRVENYPKDYHAPLDRFFAGWLERRGYTPGRIYTMHGSGLALPEHLEKLRASSASDE